MPSIEVSISDDELAKWTGAAALTGESLSEMVRRSVNKHLVSVEKERAAWGRLEALIDSLGGHRIQEATDEDLAWWEAIDWES